LRRGRRRPNARRDWAFRSGRGADLITVGYGKSKSKDPGRPQASVNCRVRVVNMDDKTTASK
jgi:hypothetical protein